MQKIHIQKIVTEKENIIEAIVQAVAEAARVAVQAMAATGAQTAQYMKEHKMWGPKICRPRMK